MIGCDKPDAGATRAALALRAVLAKDHTMHLKHLLLGARAPVLPIAVSADIKMLIAHLRGQQKWRERVILRQPFVISGQASAQHAVAA